MSCRSTSGSENTAAGPPLGRVSQRMRDRFSSSELRRKGKRWLSCIQKRPAGEWLDMMRDLLNTLTRTRRFRTFVTVLAATYLDDDLRGGGTFDVYAVGDDDLDLATVERLDALLAGDAETLIDFAEMHVRERELVLSHFPLQFDVVEHVVCTNGVLHIVKDFTWPPYIERRVMQIEARA